MADEVSTVDAPARGAAETAFRLMQFALNVERREHAPPPKTRQDILALYASCHRVVRGEPVPSRPQRVGSGSQPNLRAVPED